MEICGRDSDQTMSDRLPISRRSVSGEFYFGTKKAHNNSVTTAISERLDLVTIHEQNLQGLGRKADSSWRLHVTEKRHVPTAQTQD